MRWNSLKRWLGWCAKPIVAVWRLFVPASPGARVTPKAAASSVSTEIHAPVVVIVVNNAAQAALAPTVILSGSAHAAGSVVIHTDRIVSSQPETVLPVPLPREPSPPTAETASPLTLGPLLASACILALLLYLNHSPCAVVALELARSLGLLDMASAACHKVIEALCRRWQFCAAIRDWIAKIAREPVGKAMGRQLGALATHKGHEAIEALCRRWRWFATAREAIVEVARRPVDDTFDKPLGIVKRAAKMCWQRLRGWLAPNADPLAPMATSRA